MNRAVLLSRVVAFFSAILLLVSLFLFAFTVGEHRNGLVPYVLVWIGFTGLIVSPSALVLFFEKAAYASRHRRVIIGSWVYLVCGAIVSIANVVLYPSWEKLHVVPVSAGENPALHFLVVAVPVVLVFFGLMRERLIELMEKKRALRHEGSTTCVYCAFCGNKLIGGQPFCANCGRRIEAQPFQLPPSESRPTVAELPAQPQRGSLSASVLSLIGGATILLLGVLFSDRPTLSPATSQMAFALSFLTGIPILCLAWLLVKKPSHHETWGVLIIVFSALSILCGGGYIAGMILGIVGGALAIAWKQK